MNVFSIFVICIIVSVFAVYLKSCKPEYSAVLIIITISFICIDIVKELVPIINEIKGIEISSLFSKYLNIVFKALAICFASQLCSDICKENGQISVSTCVETIGKIAVVAISLPIYKEIINIISKILGNI